MRRGSSRSLWFAKDRGGRHKRVYWTALLLDAETRIRGRRASFLFCALWGWAVCAAAPLLGWRWCVGLVRSFCPPPCARPLLRALRFFVLCGAFFVRPHGNGVLRLPTFCNSQRLFVRVCVAPRLRSQLRRILGQAPARRPARGMGRLIDDLPWCAADEDLPPPEAKLS